MNEVTVGTKEKNSRKLERIKLTGHHSKLKVKSQQSKPRSLVLGWSFYPLPFICVYKSTRVSYVLRVPLFSDLLRVRCAEPRCLMRICWIR